MTGTVDIDSLDSHEYSINPFFDKLMMKIKPANFM